MLEFPQKNPAYRCQESVNHTAKSNWLCCHDCMGENWVQDET